jgi:hypothetical protein
MFYPASEQESRREIEAALERAQPVIPDGRIIGGMVPHAGWTFSGPTAAHLYKALHAQREPATIILFGAVHRWGVSRAGVYASGRWRTPLGDVEVDEDLAQRIVSRSNGDLVNNPGAHEGEHSIEVQLPFIKYLFDETRIVPIAMPPESDAPRIGHHVAQVAAESDADIVAISSSDLTHYGPRYGLNPAGSGQAALDWAHENDQRFLNLVIEMREQELVAEAQEHRNACGAGAVAAAVGYARELGATDATLLDYTTSFEVMPMGRATDMVGYGAVSFQE